MGKMKFSGISSCLRFAALVVVCVVISACSAESVSVATPSVKEAAQQNESEVQSVSKIDVAERVDNAGHLTVSAQAFFRALMSLNKNAAGGGNLNFHMPAIWIFSPQGDLTRIVQDEQDLAIFQSEFSSIDPQAPNISCQSIEQAAVNINKETWDMGCAGDQWVALLLDTPTECERVCMAYKSALAQVEHEHQDTLQVRTLLVDMGS